MEGIIHIDNFIEGPALLLALLAETVNWDERMIARKTASYGKAYNYSQISYPSRPFLPELAAINQHLPPAIGFLPNNCLVNYYPDGTSSMGFHSDQTDILAGATGIAIISLGATRVLKFRNIVQRDLTYQYELKSGSLLYMTQDIQHKWQHAILKDATKQGRISLTFRAII